jgi:hypothetical protein
LDQRLFFAPKIVFGPRTKPMPDTSMGSEFSGNQHVDPLPSDARVFRSPISLAWPGAAGSRQAALGHHPQVSRQADVRDVLSGPVVDGERVEPSRVRDIPESRPLAAGSAWQHDTGGANSDVMSSEAETR